MKAIWFVVAWPLAVAQYAEERVHPWADHWPGKHLLYALGGILGELLWLITPYELWRAVTA